MWNNAVPGDLNANPKILGMKMLPMALTGHCAFKVVNHHHHHHNHWALCIQSDAINHDYHHNQCGHGDALYDAGR